MVLDESLSKASFQPLSLLWFVCLVHIGMLAALALTWLFRCKCVFLVQLRNWYKCRWLFFYFSYEMWIIGE